MFEITANNLERKSDIKTLKLQDENYSITFFYYGEYEEDKRDLKLELRGSSNQRIRVLNTQDNIAKIYSNKTVTSNSLRDDIKYKLN